MKFSNTACTSCTMPGTGIDIMVLISMKERSSRQFHTYWMKIVLNYVMKWGPYIPKFTKKLSTTFRFPPSNAADTDASPIRLNNNWAYSWPLEVGWPFLSSTSSTESSRPLYLLSILCWLWPAVCLSRSWLRSWKGPQTTGWSLSDPS